MKKLLLCIFLVLMFCNTGFAEENAEMIGYKEKKLDYNFECLSLDKKNKKLFGFKIYSNPNKISGLDGKDEILFKVPYFNKLYGLPTSLVIAVDINGEEFRVTLTDQIIGQVNNLKTLYNTTYEDPESFEQVSAEISSIIQEISNSVEPKPDDGHLDNLIQQVIKIVDDRAHEENMQSKDSPSSKKVKKRNKKTKSKK